MDSSKLANWLQILGNFGLVVGLILVAVQIKQNTDIARAQLFSDGVAIGMNMDLAIMGENPAAVWAKAQSDHQQPTDEELAVLYAFLNYFWKSMVRTETLTEMGLPTRSPQNGAQQFVGGQYGIGDAFGLAWWDMTKTTGFAGQAPATREAVNTLLEQEGRVDHHLFKANRLTSIKGRMSELARR